MRTIATALTLAACITLAGCESLPQWFQPTTNPDGSTAPSAFEDTIRTSADVAPAFGPAGIAVGAILSGIAGVLEVSRRRERKAKDRVADSLRIVAGAIDAVKLEDIDAADKVVTTIKARSLPCDRKVIDHVRGKATDRTLERAGV